MTPLPRETPAFAGVTAREGAGRVHDSARWPFAAAALLCLASVLIRWPGVAMYDSVSQYQQALAGEYADWHPPVMAHLWALLARVWPGAAPFLLLQMLLWWSGLGLIAGALARKRRGIAAALVLAAGACPLFLGWATVALKDAQMAACLVAATGLVAWSRLDGRAQPKPALAAVAVLIAYATLVRGNAVFATVPLALALGDWAGVRRRWTRGLLAMLGIVAVLAIAPILNHRLMRAEATHNDRSLPLYDIAGIAHRAHVAPPGIAPAEWAEAERRGCYTPYFWNPYGEPSQCDAIGQALAFGPGGGTLMRDWAALVVAHPFAYAAHRLAHFNATLRFLVGAGEPDAIPPLDSEPNGIGLGAPSGSAGRLLIAAARALVETPIGWPVTWLAAGAALLWGLRGAVGADAALARALSISALAMSGSFAVASIACDLRYHLWSMIAVALALALGVRSVPWRGLAIGGSVTAAVAVVTLIARAITPAVYVPLPPRVAPPAILAH